VDGNDKCPFAFSWINALMLFPKKNAVNFFMRRGK
jgi:hypothetical protein